MKYFVLSVLLALVEAGVYIGISPHESFKKMSSDDNFEWNTRAKVGAALGFVVFGVAYISTVFAIFLDIKKSSENYDEMIQDDLSEIKKLGLHSKLAEFEAELQIRLSGKKFDSNADDQLLGEAAKLTRDQYEKYM